MHMESAESTLLAAAKAAEREKVLWPYYCRKMKTSVTREDCLNNRLEALLMQKGHCATCQIGQALSAKKHGAGQLVTEQERRVPVGVPDKSAEAPRVEKASKSVEILPKAKPEPKVKAAPAPKKVNEVGPVWLPSAEELKAAGICQETEADEGDPFAGLEFEAAPDRRIQPAAEGPQVSFRKCGEVYLNRPAAERLGDATYALLRFAPRARVIGIKPETERVPGASKLRMDTKRSKNGRCLSCLGSLKAWGLLPDEATSLPAEWSEAHGMWCVRLPAEGR